MGKYVFGVDIGGTTVKIGLFDVEGKLLDKWEITTRTDEGGKYILGDIAEQGLDGLDGLHLLLQRGQLPKILLGCLLNLVLRELQLQPAHVLAHLGELIAVNNLSTSENGLHGLHTCDGAVLHHRDADRIGQGCKCLRRKRLCKGCS